MLNLTKDTKASSMLFARQGYKSNPLMLPPPKKVKGIEVMTVEYE